MCSVVTGGIINGTNDGGTESLKRILTICLWEVKCPSNCTDVCFEVQNDGGPLIWLVCESRLAKLWNVEKLDHLHLLYLYHKHVFQILQLESRLNFRFSRWRVKRRLLPALLHTVVPQFSDVSEVIFALMRLCNAGFVLPQYTAQHIHAPPGFITGKETWIGVRLILTWGHSLTKIWAGRAVWSNVPALGSFRHITLKLWPSLLLWLASFERLPNEQKTWY
jgi:hypothetical protein